MADIAQTLQEAAQPTIVQPEVQKFLEAVFAVAPHPEEYVRYRLHLATALSPDFLDSWFEQRRTAAKIQEDATLMRLKTVSGLSVPSRSDDPSSQQAQGRSFSLFGAAPNPPSSSVEQRSLALLASTTQEVQDVDRLLSIMQQNSWEGGPSLDSSATQAPDLLRGGRPTSNGEFDLRADNRFQTDLGYDLNHLAARNDSMNSELPINRFTEADLDVVSQLVGLERLTSTETHCGSRSLYMFEQLTALDSLDPDSSGTRRKRTRHQHFWRNTDKLDPRDRVYVSTASLKPALQNDQPVVPKKDISPDERTNSWTVCLTVSGVVGYLNKRISPLGVQMIRALARRCRAAAAQAPTIVKAQPLGALEQPPQLGHEENSSGFRRVRAKSSNEREELIRPQSRERSLSTSDGISSDGARSNPHGANGERHQNMMSGGFEPLPRARRRKPA